MDNNKVVDVTKEIKKLLEDIAKSTKTGKGGFKVGSEVLNGAVSLLGEEAVIASGAVGGLVAGLTALTVAGGKASQANLQVYQSLRQLGEVSDSLSVKSLENANNLIRLKEQWSGVVKDFEELFEPIFAGLLKFGNDFGRASGLGKGTVLERGNNESQNILIDYANGLLAKNGTPTDQSMSILNDIVTGGKQLGFSNNSSAYLGTNIYDMALEAQKKYGISAQDIAPLITKSIMSGDNSASQFGLNLSDDVLKGWLMQEKGIDAVNTQMSEAKLSAYRLELAQLEMNQVGSDSLQKQISQWKQYGSLIESTKNQLFSFDEVITMQANDFSIPELGVDGSITSELTSDLDEAQQKKDKLATPLFMDVNSNGPDLLNNMSNAVLNMPKEVNINVTSNGPELLNNMSNAVLSIPREVNINVTETGLSSILAKATQVFETLNGVQPANATGLVTSGAPAKVNSHATGLVPSNQFIGEATKKKSTLEKVNDWLIDSGVTSWAQNQLDNGILSKSSQKSMGKAMLGMLTLPYAAGKVGQAISGGLTKAGDLIGSLVGSGLVGAHATGGVSTHEHLATISEGNNAEVIIPLNNSSANPAYQQIGEEIANRIGGAGGNITLNVHLGENGVIVKDDRAIQMLTETIADRTTQLLRDRGALNYGMQ